jgi:hypothetical protein
MTRFLDIVAVLSLVVFAAVLVAFLFSGIRAEWRVERSRLNVHDH